MRKGWSTCRIEELLSSLVSELVPEHLVGGLECMLQLLCSSLQLVGRGVELCVHHSAGSKSFPHLQQASRSGKLAI